MTPPQFNLGNSLWIIRKLSASSGQNNTAKLSCCVKWLTLYLSLKNAVYFSLFILFCCAFMWVCIQRISMKLSNVLPRFLFIAVDELYDWYISLQFYCLHDYKRWLCNTEILSLTSLNQLKKLWKHQGSLSLLILNTLWGWVLGEYTQTHACTHTHKQSQLGIQSYCVMHRSN